MPLKVLDANGAGTADDVAAAIRFAVAHGARIINASVSGAGRSQVLEDAIREARDAGAAGGHRGGQRRPGPRRPARLPGGLPRGQRHRGRLRDARRRPLHLLQPRPPPRPGGARRGHPHHRARRRLRARVGNLDGGAARLGHPGPAPGRPPRPRRLRPCRRADRGRPPRGRRRRRAAARRHRRPAPRHPRLRAGALPPPRPAPPPRPPPPPGPAPDARASPARPAGAP